MFDLFESKEEKAVVHDDMTLEQVYVAILKLMADVSVNHHRMGLLYNHVVKKKLAQKVGFKDAQTWFRLHLAELSQSSLSLYGAVAGAFSEQSTQRFGISRLGLLLTYEEVADKEGNHAEPGNTPIEVPDDTGKVTEKPFSACTAEELRKAIKRKRKPSSSKPLPPGAEELAEQCEEELTDRFPAGTRVTVAPRNQKGKAVMDFKGVPMEQVSMMMAALTGQPLPVREVRRVEAVAPQA